MRAFLGVLFLIGCSGSAQTVGAESPRPEAKAAQPVVAEAPKSPPPSDPVAATPATPPEPCALGTFGSVPPGTTGLGLGSPAGYGAGRRHGGAHSPTVTIGESLTAKGSLDHATIRRQVKRHWAEIRFCYEKQLAIDSKLTGKATVTFSIDAEGNVSTAAAQGLHANVETCLVRVFRRIRFPKPAAGTVDVTFPLVFASTTRN